MLLQQHSPGALVHEAFIPDNLTRDELLDLLYLLDEDEKRECEQSYFKFFLRAWEVLEPETSVNVNWHIPWLCNRLQEEMTRIGAKQHKGRDIIINVPFRTGKTRIVTELLQPWAWTRWPWMKFITWSYSSELSIDKTVESRRVIQSEWYQSNWGEKYSLAADQNVKSHFSNDKGGSRRATSTGGTVTGQGGHVLIGDDPLNPKQADSDIERKACNDHYDKTMGSRLDDPKVGVRIIVMQRLHETDLTGHLLTSDPEGWEHICIPGEISEQVKPPELRKHYVGGLFDPVRLDKTILAGHRRRLGSYGFSGQIQQTPSPDTGGMFKQFWWRYWQPKGAGLPPVEVKTDRGDILRITAVELPDSVDEIAQFWDLAFGDGEFSDDGDSSFVAGAVWARVAAKKFLLDLFHEQVDFPGTCTGFEAMTKKWPGAYAKYVEKKANGAAMIASLGRKIPGIVPLPAETDKITRARPASVSAEAGDLYLPHPLLYTWVDPFIDEHKKFPKGKQNDRVDTTAHMVNKFDSGFDYQETQLNI